MKNIILLFWLLTGLAGTAQIKILFDATKAETANNADWQIDADNFNLKYNPNPVIGGNEANPQRFPSPDQSTVTMQTDESYWTGANSAWGIELVQYGYQVETLPYNGQITYGDSNNPQDLTNYNVFIVTEPNILFTANEKLALMNFVQNGGGLFITSDHDRSDRNGDGDDSVDVWNDFFQNNPMQSDPFGFLFNYKNFSETTSNVANLPSNPILHGFFGDVTALEFHGGTSINLFPTDNNTVQGLIFRQSLQDEALFVSAQFGQGRVVAIGDSSPADDGTGDPHDRLYNGWYDEGNGSHRKLMLNASVWLAHDDTNAIANYNKKALRTFVKNDFLYIKLKYKSKVRSIVINDLTGKTVLKFSKSANNYNIATLPHGIYLLNVSDQRGNHYYDKFMK